MNKDKWNKIFLDEVNAYQHHSITASVTPENWAEEKQKLLKFVENVDKATEVYNLENNIKG
jgi:hypothetical protein